MEKVITRKIAEYDVSEFTDSHIKHYLQNPDEFIDRYEFYKLDDLTVGDLKEKEVTKEIVQEIVWIDEHLPSDAYEQFEYDMSYFDKYSGETFSIIGSNMGWQNRTGQKDVEVSDGMDLFEAIRVDSDLNFRIWRESDDAPGVYHAGMSHHYSPTGEHYELTLKS
jgi:hypothetical protein